MLAGSIAVLDRPADESLEDTTADESLPALSVDATQTDLSADSVAQECTAAGAIRTERDVPVVTGNIITTTRESQRVEVAADLVADVTGYGLVLPDRTAGGGRYPFPLDLVAAQTGRELTRHRVDVEAFAEAFADDLHDTWLVGDEDPVRRRSASASTCRGTTCSRPGCCIGRGTWRSTRRGRRRCSSSSSPTRSSPTPTFPKTNRQNRRHYKPHFDMWTLIHD